MAASLPLMISRYFSVVERRLWPTSLEIKVKGCRPEAGGR